jgi:antitoxin ParD1/3/4
MANIMPTRNVVLTDHQSALLDRLIKSGRYQNASEVLREGLRLVEREEAETKARIAALRDAARIGLSDVEAGQVRSFDTPQALGRHLADLAESALTPPTRSKHDN